MIVRRRYYLSEMAVSDKHGGGLTLQRILRDDLDEFDLFIHSNDFATRDAPIVDRFANRQLNLHELHPMPRVTASLRRYYVDRALDCLGLKTSLEWSQDLWIRKCADHILRHVALKDSFWLVVPQHIASVRVLNRLWRRRPVQYVTWLMDDHVIEWRNGWFYPHRFEAEFAFHLRHARKVVVISPAMARLYRDRFGVDAEVLFGPADPVGSPVYRSPNPVGPVRLCYFGAIRMWQRDAIERLAIHLARVNATLDLFALQDPPAELRLPRVLVRPPVPAKDVISRMRGYDGVVIPASFHEDKRNLTELNIATKMSECFASGTVPVIVAPAYAAMAQFAREHGGAVIVSDFDAPVQVSALRSLKTGNLRERILGEARRAAETVCSSSAMRCTWKRVWDGVNAGPLSPAGATTGSDIPYLHKFLPHQVGSNRHL